MKKSIAAILAFLILFNLTGCSIRVKNFRTPEDISDLDDTVTSLPETDSFTVHSTQDNVYTTDIFENTVVPTGTPETTKQPTEKPKEELSPVFTEEIYMSTDVHTPLSPDKYYQKSFLSSSEQEIYELIVDAAKKGYSTVDVSAYSYDSKDLLRIYYAVQADYPQFFYLSGYFTYTTSRLTGAVNTVYLIYFDGSTTDYYENNLALGKEADRELISRQIKTFNNKTTQIVDMIPGDISEYEKEKMIYEYLQDSVTFDDDSNDSPPDSYSEMENHAFDSYGAACEGKAVCEGYAELFQYLCYSVGIQATIVRGKTTRANHMWNAVCLDSEWYMVDPTWDDFDEDGLHCYSYFNVTDEYIKNSAHTVDSDGLRVPSCTSTRYAFYNMYSLFIESTSESPTNYREIIDYVVSRNETYMCVYVGNQSGDLTQYFQKYVYSPQSDVQRYIELKNYPIKILSFYYNVNDIYYYIQIERH